MKNRTAILALIAAGSLWGVTVALSKLSLSWLDPSWLSAMRFIVAAPVLAIAGRRGLRDAFAPQVLASGALGFGLVILLQNAGIEQTSVSHAAIIVGALPIVVALVTVGTGNGRAPRVTWVGYGIAMLGIMLVARGGGGGATATGDMLVFASVVTSGAFIALQPRVLAGRDAAAVTAVQFAAGAAVALPVALIGGGLPHAPAAPGPVIAFAALALPGTVLPFWLFAYGQARVHAELAGAFVNLEPLIGALVGWVAFSDPIGPWQIIGALALITGLLVSLTPPGFSVTLARGRLAAVGARRS
jgi:O-acetylserine/cysteine efflux transporter